MKKALLLITSLLLTLSAMATAQYPDYIIYRGKKYALHTNPLEPYFAQFPEKRPQSDIMSTALWRGYIATFEVIDDHLYVKDIEVLQSGAGSDGQGSKSIINDVFPDKALRRMDQWTGLMVLPHGRQKEYVHMGYASLYSRYTLLEFEGGTLTGGRKFNHRKYKKFKERQFEVFKNTDEYRLQKEELLQSGELTEGFVEDFLRIFVIDYSSKILTD